MEKHGGQIIDDKFEAAAEFNRWTNQEKAILNLAWEILLRNNKKRIMIQYMSTLLSLHNIVPLLFFLMLV